MGKSFLDKYRLAIVHYKRFVQERRPERLGKDQPPLFPMSQDDLLRYYDHKFEICTYRATRNYISLLLHHPQHGPEWKRDVYDSYAVEEKKHLMREAERKGESNIQTSCVLRPLRRRSRFFSYKRPSEPVFLENEHIFNNNNVNNECQVIEGMNKGYVISTTVSKNQLLSTTPSLSPLTQQTPKVNTSGYRLLGQEQLKKDKIVSFSNKRQRFQEQKNEKRSIPNEMNTIKLNVNQLASKVHIISYVTPISHSSRGVC